MILFSAVDSSRASAHCNLGLVILRDLCQNVTVMISCDCPACSQEEPDFDINYAETGNTFEH